MKAKQKIRLKLKSYDHRLLDESVKRLVAAVMRTGSQLVGPIPLRNHERRWTVNKSPHVDKKARNQFCLIIHSRLIDIIAPNDETMGALMKLNISAGVDVEIK